MVFDFVRILPGTLGKYLVRASRLLRDIAAERGGTCLHYFFLSLSEFSPRQDRLLILSLQTEVMPTLIHQGLRDKTGTSHTPPPDKYISAVCSGSNNANIHLKQVQEKEAQIQKLFRNQRKPNAAFHSQASQKLAFSKWIFFVFASSLLP